MIKQKEKVTIAELEYPVVLKALNLFKNKLINDISKREVLDKLIIKLAKYICKTLLINIASFNFTSKSFVIER